MMITVKQVEDYLNEVVYAKSGSYMPSDFALEFVTFIKLVNGEEGEENKTPVVHFKMLDTITEGKRRITNLCHRGIAKALSVDSQVITPKGNVRMGDIQVGDELYTREGKVTTVTHKSEIFNKPMFTIELEDGRKLDVSEDHLNIVMKRLTGKRTSGGFKEYVLTTDELIAKGVTYNRKITERTPKGYESKWYVPTSALVEYAAKDIPLDPYTVGCILGDGSIDKNSGFTRLHTHENDLQHFLNHVQGACVDSVRSDNRRDSTKRFSLKGIGSKVKSFIGTENVYGKRIPQDILWSSREHRLALLRGLMDTDGTIYNNSSSYCTVSEGLANDVLWLSRSLGFEAKLGKSEGYHRVYIYADICPFLLPRKAVKWKSNKKGMIAIKAITPMEQVESQCIAVADETHSFLAESFFVTHNTTLMGEYLFLYLAVYGELPNFGKIDLCLYVSDSIENGVKNMRKNLEHRYENSDFLKQYVPNVRFTDVRWEFNNIDGKKLIVKGYGAKSCSLDTRLYTEDGYTTMGECTVGDMIYGPDGKLAEITQKSDVFNKPMYELVLEDGRSLKVSEDHYNSVMVNTNPNGIASWEDKDLTTSEILVMGWTHTKKGNHNHKGTSTKSIMKVRNTQPLEYPMAQLEVDPYTLGLILGDGSIKRKASGIVLTGDEPDMDFYKLHIPYELGTPYHDKRRPNVVTYSIKGINQNIRNLGLAVHGRDKFIPESYFFGSINQRMHLLKGLLDTDGSIYGAGRISFVSASERLTSDVARLVRSLGGKAKPVSTNDSAYYIEIWMGMNPFMLPRKAKRFILNRRHWDNCNVVDVRRIADEPSQCISIDNDLHQYVAGEYFRTHNTGVRGAKEMGKRPQLAVLDDLFSDEDAKSPTVIENVEATIYKAVTYALHPKNNIIIWSGTPFNAKDPLYKAVESGAWAVNVFPVCEQFPCSREDFRGSWPDRFTYDYVKEQYDTAIKTGKADTFNQELMLRIMSEEDRLILDCDISWYKRATVLANKQRFNFYITTDFATGAEQHNDFSVISVWAYNNNGDWLWVDGICKKQLMDANVNDLFRLAQMYRPQQVGIEVSGQQGGFIPWIQEQMSVRNLWFPIASENNNGKPGIRPITTQKKIDRFQVIVPMFKMNKIMFPVERKDSPEMVQAVNELTLVSRQGFKSKHDDFADTISMLSLLTPWKPGETGDLSQTEDGMWDMDDDDDYSENEGMSSYIV